MDQGSGEACCLVSLGGEIPSEAELESHCVLFEQEDDFIRRLNNWRTQRWSWSWYRASFGGWQAV